MAKRARQRIESYLGRLYGYAFCLTEDREQSHDLVQECALRALAAGRAPCDEPAYRAWLFKILRNLHIDRIRRSGQIAKSLDEEPPLETWQVWRCDDSLITAITVKLGLAKLTPAQREIIAAVDIAGFSYREAAELLDIPLGTVMSRLSRARQALLRILAQSNVHALPLRANRGAK